LLVGEGPTFLGGVLRRAVVAVIGEPIARAGSPAQTASAPPQGGDAVAPDGRAGLYRERKLIDGYPGLEQTGHQEQKDRDPAYLGRLLGRLSRLVDVSPPRRILVIGCGPTPGLVRVLRESGHDAVGLEPVPAFVAAAREYLGSEAAVIEGAAEAMPLPDGSFDVVFAESVLEHVTSPSKSLDEMCRLLRPGGALYLTTTNRYEISLTGLNGEYRIRFFNWLPATVRESFVYQHHHYDPSLANHTRLPAVHWFTFARLCEMGREAGFARFYSLIDLMDENDPRVGRRRLGRALFRRARYSPWLRAAALFQYGGTIVMVKLPPGRSALDPAPG